MAFRKCKPRLPYPEPVVREYSLQTENEQQKKKKKPKC